MLLITSYKLKMDDKKIVFITGAAKGIGAAVVKKFRDSDYTVVATDIRFRDFFFADGVYYYHMDVRNRENVRRVVEQVEGEIGSIDSLVNVAGIFQMKGALDTSLNEWEEIYNVNIKGVFNVTQIITGKMKLRKKGTVVVVSSNASKFPRMGMAAYASTKAAATMYTKCLALELAEYNIRCNIVSPGSTDTDMQRALWGNSKEVPKSVIKGDLEKYRLGIPLGKIAEPQEIAEMIYFLSTEKAGHITMEEVTIDGGATMGV